MKAHPHRQGWILEFRGLRQTLRKLRCFYNRVLRGIKIFVRSRPALAKFKPAPHPEVWEILPALHPEVWEILPALHPHTSIPHTPRRPSQPAPATPLSVAYQIGPCQRTTKNLLRLKTSLTSSKIKLLILFIGNQTKNFSHIWSSAVNRFEVIKNTFQSSGDQLCVKLCHIHLEGLLDWIIPHQVQR